MTQPSTRAPHLSRRRLIRGLVGLAATALLTPLSAACRARIVEVERVVKVEKEVTKIVTEIVKQTVVVERTLAAPELMPSPAAPQPTARLSIQALRTPWTLYLQRMTPAFEDLFDIALQWRPLGDWASYEGLIAAQGAARTMADLIEAPAGVLPARWRRHGLLQNMAGLAESGAVDTQDIFAPALDAFCLDDELLGWPFLVHGGDHLLGFDRQRLASLQLPRPDLSWTLAEIDDLNAALAADSAAPAGFRTSLALPAALPLLRLWRLYLFDAQGRLAVEPDRLNDLLGWARNLSRPTSAIQPDLLLSPVQALEKGQIVATCISLSQLVSWQWQALQDQEDRPRLAATLFPQRQGQTQRAISVNAMGYCLSSAAQERTAAAQWLKYVSGREMGVQLFVQGLAEPGCRSSSWNDPRVTDMAPLCAAIANELDKAQPPSMPANLEIEACYSIWNQHLARILNEDAHQDAEIDLMLQALRLAAQA